MIYDFPLEPEKIEEEEQIDYSFTPKLKKPRLHRTDQDHIEDCLRLKIGNFGRHILSRANADNPESEKMFYIQHGPLSKAQVFYRIREENLDTHLEIRCQYRGLWLTQYIELNCSSAWFGPRPYFACACGRRCSTLFLHPQRPYSFVCRRCLDLNYQLNGINKHTERGKVTYLSIMLNKLMIREESIRHRHYNNHVTKRLQAFARRYCKWQNLLEINKELINS